MQPLRIGTPWVLHGSRARCQFESALENSNGDPIPPLLSIHLALECKDGRGDPLDAMVRNLDMLRQRLDPDREISGLSASLGEADDGVALLAELLQAVGKRFPLTFSRPGRWPCVIRGERRLQLQLQRELRQLGFCPVDAISSSATPPAPSDRFGIGPGAASCMSGWQFLAPNEWSEYRSSIDAGVYPVVQAKQVLGVGDG
ncbi:MAG: hypothetical protein KDJ14_05790 [Xanthomonadales bacterium]|nr:hypothetical protein [Xanthomonadales bacterium]